MWGDLPPGIHGRIYVIDTVTIIGESKGKRHAAARRRLRVNAQADRTVGRVNRLIQHVKVVVPYARSGRRGEVCKVRNLGEGQADGDQNKGESE